MIFNFNSHLNFYFLYRTFDNIDFHKIFYVVSNELLQLSLNKLPYVKNVG